MRPISSLPYLFLLAGLTAASPLAFNQKRAACAGNSPTDRSKWCDYSLSTDYYNEVPDTGVTREYWLNVEEGTLAPDGFERYVQTFNGTIPGPTIIADWGDNLVIHVTNNMGVDSNNGTSVHWHGIRQKDTNQMDGVVSLTQCPIVPGGETTTYRWRATQYGTTWYHSHQGLQAWEGLYGGILINGPASANYDEDKGVLFLSDWSHATVDSLWNTAENKNAGIPPELDNGLINGTNVFDADGESKQTGKRFATKFTSGSSYRLRVVNSALDSFFHFSIDNHTMTVIESDLVPIKPFETSILNIGIGQRYDVIVKANQGSVADNFWMRAVPGNCSSKNSAADNIKGIIYYGDAAETPSTQAWSDPSVGLCNDMPYDSLVPYLAKDAGEPTYHPEETVTAHTSAPLRWKINGESFQVLWGEPTVLQVLDNTTNFTASENVIEVDEADKWVYLVVENEAIIPHPIHLHGHDFYLLAQSNSSYSSSAAVNLDNPPRRDVAMAPAEGYIVLGFLTDNPGAWLVHCHIGWHVAMGLALQVVEQKSKIPGLTNGTALREQCDAWGTYSKAHHVVDLDSGV